jgi:hypothetical protein
LVPEHRKELRPVLVIGMGHDYRRSRTTGRPPGEEPLGHPAPALGQRLPRQRLDLAQFAGAAREAGRSLTDEEWRLALHDKVAELYGLST